MWKFGLHGVFKGGRWSFVVFKCKNFSRWKLYYGEAFKVVLLAYRRWWGLGFCLACTRRPESSRAPLQYSSPAAWLDSCAEALQWAGSRSWTLANLVKNRDQVFSLQFQAHQATDPDNAKYILLSYNSSFCSKIEPGLNVMFEHHYKRLKLNTL